MGIPLSYQTLAFVAYATTLTEMTGANKKIKQKKESGDGDGLIDYWLGPMHIAYA